MLDEGPVARRDLVAWSHSLGVAHFLFGPVMSLVLRCVVGHANDPGNGPSEYDGGDYPNKPDCTSDDHEILLPAVASR